MPKPDRPRLARGGRTLSETVCGDRVYSALMEARPAGLPFKQLVVATQMSAHHTRKGLNYVKDVPALERKTPLIWTRKHGFQLSDNPSDWIAFEVEALSAELTHITRTTKRVFAPHAAARPDDAFAELALDYICGMKAGLTGIIAAGKNIR
ncbi:hypothetical protein ACIBG7_42845 [Nonomuraea sp. NPDC050328]|uniref:hypothetical protein n=1 Tax=Nonomuraea sp. NPDC050328 TaxID=3364361 RepID=UPI0037A384B5